MNARTAETTLSWTLIAMGALAMLAAVAVVMPTSTMEAVNDWLGLGPFPHSVLTEYLTRSVSAIYCLLGVLTVYIARNVRRYRELIVVMAWLTVVLGAVLWVLDLRIGMPALWAWSEGPFGILLGLLWIWLAGKVEAG